MTEPETWAQLDMTELERKLLDAAKTDRVPSQLGARIAGALSASSIAPAAGASALGHGGLLFSKTGLWGFLSVALLAAGGALYAAGSAPRADAATRAAPMPATATVAPSAQLVAVVPMPSSAVPEPAAAAADDARDPAVPAGEMPSSPAHADANALQQEIALLDRARAALQQGAPARASAVLDRHRARFAHGTLMPEAEALRIETLVRLGQRGRAQALSQHFLSAYPAHPLRERVQGLSQAPARR